MKKSFRIVGAAIGCLTILELFLAILSRIFYPRLLYTDRHFGWRYRPNVSVTRTYKDVKYAIETNREGFRDSEFKADGSKFNVMILGDSMTFGLESDQKELFSRLTEDNLNASYPTRNVDIMNLGVTGYSTSQESLVFQKFGPIYHPKVVGLIFFDGNDFDDSASVVSAGRFHPHYDCTKTGLSPHFDPTTFQRFLGTLQDYSAIFFILNNRYRWFDVKHNLSAHEKELCTGTVLEKLFLDVKASGAQFFMIYLKMERTEDRWLAMQARANRLGFRIEKVDLPPEYQQTSSVHLNFRGQKLLTQKLTEMVSRYLP